MKRVVGVALVAMALGIWVGVRASTSVPGAVNSQAVLAIVIGANLVLCLWVRYRARPGSGEAQLMTVVALLMVAMLVGILPGLFWPDAEGIHIAGSIASLILTMGVAVTQIRRIVLARRR